MAPHIHPNIDFTVEVFVVHKNRVLLRMHDKYKMWLSIGGHIELDEDPNEAAVREVKEEVGLDVVLWDGNQKLKYEREGFRELIPPIALNRHDISGAHEHVSAVYFGRAQSDTVAVEHGGDRSDEWRWVTKSELADMNLRPDVRFYAELALDTLDQK
jgi:8-oxo-dGTP pyrophosphatase MutT (NUDIX family)